jgi:hypothetical protein
MAMMKEVHSKLCCEPVKELPVFWFRSWRRAGALLYSLLGTCRLNGADPEHYLRHVLNVIADWPVNWVSELLPSRVVLPAE